MNRRWSWTVVLLLACLPTIAPVGLALMMREPDRYRMSRQAPTKDAEALIVYTVGTPFKTVTDMTASEIDAVTNPTPMSYNTRVIASELGERLEARGLRVRVAEASDVTHEDVLRHRVLVLGSPTHYWNIDWQMKRFLDDRMTPIYVAHKESFRGWPVAGFTMAEIQPSADQALERIQRFLKDCGTDLSVSQSFLTVDNEDQYSRSLERLADGIEALAKRAGDPR